MGGDYGRLTTTIEAGCGVNADPGVRGFGGVWGGLGGFRGV